MASKTHEAARAKTAKEKKLLALLAVPLVGALFFAYHTVSKLHHSAPAVTPAAETTPASSVPTVTTSATTSPATPVSPVVAPAPDTGLRSLARLAPKDPFHDQGPRVAAAPAGSTTSHKTHHRKAAKSHKAKKRHKAKKPSPPPTSAVVSVNGTLMTLAVGATFPSTGDPVTSGMFKLVGLTAKTAKIAVAGGSYANGAHTLTLKVDVAVTLMNTANGQRYTLVLYPQGTPGPAATTTTPATVTTTTTPSG